MRHRPVAQIARTVWIDASRMDEWISSNMKRIQMIDGATKCRLRKRMSLIAAGILMLATAVAAEPPPEQHAGAHADDHAPIGVMGDHTHDAGEWMVSYRYMRMRMNGNRDNDDRVSATSVLRDFPVAPTRMDMQMHMFGVMFAPIDRVTMMLMVPYVSLDMSHRLRNGARFATRSDGLGDIRTAALVRLIDEHDHHLHAQIGLSFPSGSLTEQDETPASGGTTVRLPYPMQIGSGTYDFLPGLTYTGSRSAYSWGAQVRGEIRMNENHAEYRQGDEYALTGWGGIELADWVSTTLRLEWQHSLNYRGRDESPSVNPIVVPTADPDRRAGMRLDVLLGVNLIAPSGPLKGFRLAVEAGLPAYQRLDGPQLETDWIVTTGVQYAF
jgi:hypothetical protein